MNESTVRLVSVAAACTVGVGLLLAHMAIQLSMMVEVVRIRQRREEAEEKIRAMKEEAEERRQEAMARFREMRKEAVLGETDA